MKTWNGAIFPHRVLIKHRDYCGDITNHYDIDDVEYEYDEVGGVITVTVTVLFVESDEVAYDYFIEFPSTDGTHRLTTEEIEEEIKRQILQTVEI